MLVMGVGMADADNIGPGTRRDRVFQEEERQDRMYVMLGTVLLAILLIIVILFFWRSCNADSADGTVSSGGAQIVSVPNSDPVENAVSVWVRPGEDLDVILSRNGIETGDIADLGEGTYVLTVDDAERVVAELKDDPGLYDAGFIYTEGD